MLRAYRYFGGFYGGDVRAWLLQIVRNTSYTWLEKNRLMHMTDEFNEELHMQSSATLESIAIAGDDRERLQQALETLPPRFREVLVLRELEECDVRLHSRKQKQTETHDVKNLDSVRPAVCRSFDPGAGPLQQCLLAFNEPNSTHHLAPQIASRPAQKGEPIRGSGF
jgi:hypothetical protein